MRRSTILAAAVSLSLAQTATADNVGRDPNYQTPGSPNYQPLVAPPPVERYTLPPVAVREEREPSIAAAATVFVKKIRVEGVTAFRPEEIAAAVAPYEGRDVSSAELQALRVALTRLYVDAGYVSSGVLLPDQKVVDGVVVYKAVEGRLAEIELVGHPHISERYVAGRVQRHVDDPLRVSDVQYALRYLQQDPNIARLDAQLVPGDVVGASRLRLAVDETPRFYAGLSADNHRSASTGSERASAVFGFRNLTGYGEELRASTALSDGAKEGSAVLSVPLSARNIRLQAYYSLSDADIVERPFNKLDINSETESWGASLTVPLVEELDSRFAVIVGLESNRSETTLGGLPFSLSPGSVDGVAETAVAQFGLDWVKRGRSSVAGLRATYRRGLDMFGATMYAPNPGDPFCNPAIVGGAYDPCNPTGADGKFGLVQLQATFVQRLNGIAAFKGLNDRAQFVFRSSAQLAQDPLLSMEKLAIGGVNTVRGFPENLLVRDNGVAATIELQLPLPGFRSGPGLSSLVFVPFVDFGRSWDKRDTDPGSLEHDTDDARHVLAAGLGLLWQPLKGLDLSAYWGGDVANNFKGDDPRDFGSNTLQDDGFHFSVSYVARW